MNFVFCGFQFLFISFTSSRDTFEVRKTDNLTGLSMIRINETAGPMPPPLDDPNSDSTQLCVSIQPEPVKKFFPQIVKEAFLQYSSALKAFFSQLLDRQSRKTADVYGYMFLCDFVNFFVILFGFSAFGVSMKMTGSVTGKPTIEFDVSPRRKRVMVACCRTLRKIVFR